MVFEFSFDTSLNVISIFVACEWSLLGFKFKQHTFCSSFVLLLRIFDEKVKQDHWCYTYIVDVHEKCDFFLCISVLINYDQCKEFIQHLLVNFEMYFFGIFRMCTFWLFLEVLFPAIVSKSTSKCMQTGVKSNYKLSKPTANMNAILAQNWSTLLLLPR